LGYFLVVSIKEKFGRKVSTLRKVRAISQEELAQLSGLHRTYISDLERGRRNVALENIEKIANALGQDIKELFNFDQE
jgi:transcriptional regulator with XRE-family HTH domain